MKQLSIRNVPPDLALALHEERRRRDHSLNQTVLDLLRRALGLSPLGGFNNGLDQLAGTWTVEDHASFEASTASFKEIDDELWR